MDSNVSVFLNQFCVNSWKPPTMQYLTPLIVCSIYVTHTVLTAPIPEPFPEQIINTLSDPPPPPAANPYPDIDITHPYRVVIF